MVWESAERLTRLILQWHITERCNQSCVHCYQSPPIPREHSLRQKLMVLGQFGELLVWLRQHGAPAALRGHITVSGGEPFLCEDFFDLLGAFAAQRAFLSFSILTNGSFIDQRTAVRLNGLRPSFVQVSIDGTEPTHNSLRGHGSFGRSVKALNHLVQAGVTTYVSFTASRRNFREFEQVAQLCHKLGVNRLWADRHIPVGNGSDLHTLNCKETLEFFSAMYKAGRRRFAAWPGKTEISMRRGLQFLISGGKPYRCSAGAGLITVLPDGDLLPCRRMPLRVGNVMETPLVELYAHSATLNALRDTQRVSKGCEACLFARKCRGGSRCLSYAATRNPFVADPGCWLAQRSTPSVVKGLSLERENRDEKG